MDLNNLTIHWCISSRSFRVEENEELFDLLQYSFVFQNGPKGGFGDSLQDFVITQIILPHLRWGRHRNFTGKEKHYVQQILDWEKQIHFTVQNLLLLTLCLKKKKKQTLDIWIYSVFQVRPSDLFCFQVFSMILSYFFVKSDFFLSSPYFSIFTLLKWGWRMCREQKEKMLPVCLPFGSFY